MVEISRKRPFGDIGTTINGNVMLLSDSETKLTDTFYLSHKFWVALVSTFVCLFAIVDLNYHTFPDPAKNIDSIQRQDFIEQNARDFLDHVCGFGPRHVGSAANEVLVKEDLLRRIQRIKDQSKAAHRIEYQIQTPSGCFDLDFIGHFTNCYDKVDNVLVKIAPSTDLGNTSALLVNCHYDTAISSPGKTDHYAK